MDLTEHFDKEFSAPSRTRVHSVRAVGTDGSILRGRGAVIGDSGSLRHYLVAHPRAKQVIIEIEVANCRTGEKKTWKRVYSTKYLKNFL